MMKQSKNRHASKGFTLIEMLFVLVIIAMIIFVSTTYIQQRAFQMRLDRTAAQMQQILNASLSYYVTNGKWPASIKDLYGVYLPPVVLPATDSVINPWGNPYLLISYTPAGGGTNPPPPQLAVWTAITAGGRSTSAANVIAGMLPLAYTSAGVATPTAPPSAAVKCQPADPMCYVVSSVNIPGQNINNAGAVNFAGLYRAGSCVPVPNCPLDNLNQTMEPQIMVVPVSVSGLADPNTQNVYPISSFSATVAPNGYKLAPDACPNAPSTPACPTTPPGQLYWRVCLQVITEKGDTQATPNLNFVKNVSLMAITRCAIKGQPVGSPFNLYGTP